MKQVHQSCPLENVPPIGLLGFIPSTPSTWMLSVISISFEKNGASIDLFASIAVRNSVNKFASFTNFPLASMNPFKSICSFEDSLVFSEAFPCFSKRFSLRLLASEPLASCTNVSMEPSMY